MSEQNILNPAVTSQLNPDYSVKVTDPAIIARWQARSGKPFFRHLAARGSVWDLQWANRMFTDADALRQWFHQYEKDFFSFVDWDSGSGRYYSGMFADQPTVERAGFNKVNISAQFVEVPTLPQFQYPSRWGTDSVFRLYKDGFGSNLIKLTGSGWFLQNPQTLSLAGSSYTSPTTNDFAEWEYFGYGFRVWALKAASRGIAEVSLDGVVLGTYDQYSAANLNSAPLWTQLNVALGMHRVKLRVTGTKNASSSAFNIDVDAIEVMR